MNFPPLVRQVGNKLVDPTGKQVVLRGCALTALDHAKNTYGVQNIVNRAMDVWKCKLIRIPTRQNPDTSATGLQTLFNIYKEFIDYITSKGGYVIIDLHRIGNPLSTEAQDKVFWEYMAPRFKDYPNVFFELYNEPNVSAQNNQITNANFFAYVNRQLKVVRDAGAKNLVLVPGQHYDQLIKEVLQFPITDTMSDSYGIAQVAHLYPGGWARTNSDLFAEVDMVSDVMPVIVTECGFDADRSQNNDVYGAYEDLTQPNSQRWNFGKISKQRMEAKKVSFTFWVLNRLVDGWFPVPCNDDWSPRAMPKYCGQFYFNWLTELQNSDVPSNPSPVEPPVKETIKLCVDLKPEQIQALKDFILSIADNLA